MQFAIGILALLGGIGVLGFGLLLFYTFLPLFYGVAGIGLGYWIGVGLSGNELGSPGIIELIAAIIGGVLFAAAAYTLEGVRRLLTGGLLGGLLGLAIGAALGADSGVIMFILAVVFAIGGAIAFPMAFDPLIVISSTITGAAMIMDGGRLILPDVSLVDRSLITAGDIMPLVVWIVLAAVGLGWQFRNLSYWVTASELTDSSNS